MTTFLARTLLAAVATTLAGCGTFLKSERQDRDSRDRLPMSEITIHGAAPTTKRDIEDINLLHLLDPEEKARAAYEDPNAKPPKVWSALELSERYDLAFRFFDRYQYSSADYMRVRNDIQERMLAASERRCGRFERHLREQHSDTNFGLGLATTITAGLGALVPGLRASQNLAGTAAILSGSRAEFNDAYFSNLTVSVIVRGIGVKRKEDYARIANLQQQDGTRYPVSAAVKDAVAYDALCNVVTGLEQANDALTKRDEPGLDAINRTLVKTSVMRLLAANPEDAPEAIARLKTLTEKLNEAGINVSQALPTFPRPSGPASPDSTPAIPANAATDAQQQLKAFASKVEGEVLAKLPEAVAKAKADDAKAVQAALAAATRPYLEAFGKYTDGCAAKPGYDYYKEFLVAAADLKAERGKKAPSDVAVTQLGLVVSKTQGVLSFFKSTMDAALGDARTALLGFRDKEMAAVEKLTSADAAKYKPATALAWADPAKGSRAACDAKP